MKGVRASRPSADTALSDVLISKFNNRDTRTWVEVKMNHTDNLSNPRVFYADGRWQTTYKTPAATSAVNVLNDSAQAQAFVKSISKFSKIPLSKIIIPTNKGMLNEQWAVPLEMMRAYFSQPGINRYIANKPGPIKNELGQRIGEHVGLSFYTLGQRQGLGIGGLKAKGQARGGGEHTPWFVARKDLATNTLYVVQGHDHPWLLSHQLTADNLSWCAGVPPNEGTYGAKTRYRQADAACTFTASETTMQLSFTEPQWAVTPGQSAVLYEGDVCLGGGIITNAVVSGLSNTNNRQLDTQSAPKIGRAHV